MNAIWPNNINDAKVIQNRLKNKVIISPLKHKPLFIAGVDAAFMENKVIGTACLYSFPELILIEENYSVTYSSFPYIPGFLSFREGPAIIKAIEKLTCKPDLILFDGQGIAHPKSLGIASHIGVLLNIPTIGCAKSRLVGTYKEPGIKKGQWSELIFNNQIVGSVLRTRDNTRPVFVSPGNLIDMKTAREIVISCTTKFRIPEPLRRADIISKKIKKQNQNGTNLETLISIDVK